MQKHHVILLSCDLTQNRFRFQATFIFKIDNKKNCDFEYTKIYKNHIIFSNSLYIINKNYAKN